MEQTIALDTEAEGATLRRRPGIAIAAAVALVITLAGMAIGLWNPWNFVHLATPSHT